MSEEEPPAPAISRLAVRLPPFWPNNPALWFAQVEASFLCSGVTADTTKFALVVSQLDHRYAAEVEDIITAPPAADAYTRLKNELIRRMSESQEERVRQVLTQEDIGDRKPSQYLRHLRSKVDAHTVPDTLLRTLWSSRLPPQVKAIVASQTEMSLDAVADLADRIQDAIVPASCTNAAVTCSSTMKQGMPDYENLLSKIESLSQQMNENLLNKVDALTKQMSGLLTEHNSKERFRRRSRSRSSSNRSPSSSKQAGMCWYHQRFGEQAHKCNLPCTYLQQNNTKVGALGHSSTRLFVTDRKTGRKFLVDTGSDLSIIPRDKQHKYRPTTMFNLSAANNSIIRTYGLQQMELDLGLRRALTWNFTVADVSEPIIGADFLAHYQLLPDVAQAKLLDKVTGLSTTGFRRRAATSDVRVIQSAVDGYAHLLEQFPSLTRPPGAPQKVCHNTVHYINTTPGPPISCRPRRLAPDRYAIARAEFDTMLNEGIIRPSSGPWSSPLHLVPKKDGAWRPCGDYRALNARTIPDRYPVPLLKDYNHALAGKGIFTVLDCAKAYTQIPVADEDIQKTAIITPFGLFESLYMTFGLRNAAQTWQRFVDSVLRGLHHCSFAYLDDILVYSATPEEHERHLLEVFSRLDKFGVVLNTAKCVFGKTEVTFLGHLISSEGSRPLPEKIEAILRIPRPETAKELRRYLGVLNFYRNHLPHAAELQEPLTAALAGPKTKGKAPILWTPAMIKAFEASKKSVAEAALLAHPSLDAPLAVVVDASQSAVGAVLQQYVNDAWQPLAFFSRKLTPTQQQYSAYDRELLAIYAAIKYFRTQLEARVFTIYTDHKPLTYAFRQNNNKCSPRQFNQLEFISQFSTDIRHISGLNNVVADCLSRISAVSQTVDLAQLAKAQESDPELRDCINDSTSDLQLKLVEVPASDTKIYCDVSHGKTRPFVPLVLRKQVFQTLHGLCHPGIRATVKLVRSRYVWPGVEKDCRQWARACTQCQCCKVTRHVRSPLGSFPETTERYAHIHVDVVGPLPPSEGQRYLLTIIDRFTRWPEAIPVDNISTETLAAAFMSQWVARFGCPLHITSDRGRQFESDLFTKLSSFCGAVHHSTTSYHPASNGMVERLHRSLKTALMCHDVNWTTALPFVLLGLRTTHKPELNVSPAELVYGETLRLPGELVDPSTVPKVDADSPHFINMLRERMAQIRPQPASWHGERPVFVHKELNKCTHVMLRREGVKPALTPPYTGPHKVINRGEKTFEIIVNGKRNVVSVDRVKPAFVIDEPVDRHQHSTNTQPSPVAVQPTPRPPTTTPARKTRSGRSVRFPAKYANDA